MNENDEADKGNDIGDHKRTLRKRKMYRGRDIDEKKDL